MSVKTITLVLCDACGKEIPIAKLSTADKPNAVCIDGNGLAIYGENDMVRLRGDFCSRACFLRRFAEEAERIGFK